MGSNVFCEVLEAARESKDGRIGQELPGCHQQWYIHTLLVLVIHLSEIKAMHDS